MEEGEEEGGEEAGVMGVGVGSEAVEEGGE